MINEFVEFELDFAKHEEKFTCKNRNKTKCLGCPSELVKLAQRLDELGGSMFVIVKCQTSQFFQRALHPCKLKLFLLFLSFFVKRNQFNCSWHSLEWATRRRKSNIHPHLNSQSDHLFLQLLLLLTPTTHTTYHYYYYY